MVSFKNFYHISVCNRNFIISKSFWTTPKNLSVSGDTINDLKINLALKVQKFGCV